MNFHIEPHQAAKLRYWLEQAMNDANSVENENELCALISLLTPKTYTCFCVDLKDRIGTTWIGTVTAAKGAHLTTVREEAIRSCAIDWEYETPDRIACIGIASGEVDILHWEDNPS